MKKIPTLDEDQMVRVFKALADPKRFQMLREIAKAGELSCSQIGGRFPLSQPAISHHLRILYDARLLRVREEGQHHFIAVNPRLVRGVLQALPKLLRRRPRRSPAARRNGKKR
ncbi:MAG TPA: metalloregulator ArsR/SmtB family transcription factor [Terriglobia bacterium]|nr:metalloregulator ArsR/SmtB family transcription factor [Terriglobia bacterium]